VRDVVTNTSPLLYLHQLELIDLLARLYGEVVVPTAVAEELAEGARLGFDVPTPALVPWMKLASPPGEAWLELVTDLGKGERAAIALAASRRSGLVILDDRLARRHAQLVGLTVTGTLGILLKAREQGHLPAVRPVLDRLSALGFRLTPETRNAALRLAGESG
jgi:predicted nucleic acid-binding protein